jgi:proteasome lid subunit RPN8/RPN11
VRAEGADAIVLTPAVRAAILRTVGARAPEQGGLLGGSRRNGVVRAFSFDAQARRSATTYSPNTRSLNRLLAEDWGPAGIELLGFVHSHPGAARPSTGDLAYAARILDALPALSRLLLPIVTCDGVGAVIHGWVVERASRGVAVHAVPIELEADGEDEAFARVRSAYDLDRLRYQTVVVVGVGGAAEFCEGLARAFVGRMVLIDPDTIEIANLGTQQVYRRDAGRLKVDALAERLCDINPNIELHALGVALDDLDDDAIVEVAHPNPDATTLLCGCTDSFWAQARVNRLALQFGWPSLCAQLYREGRGAEITFTFPGLTPACHRCILVSRYASYLERGYRNDVTSAGTPIFATTRLNALKGFIALALLHHDPDLGAEDLEPPVRGGARWRRVARLIAARNLVQLRLDPDLGTSPGLRVFDRVLAAADGARLCFDETVWLPQRPEGPARSTPPCPDCGGSGDLRDAIGTFADTREPR